MENQKIINLLENTPNQPSKFRTKHWVEINDDSRGTYNTNSHIKFTTSMLMSSLCDYSHVYILASGTVTVVGAGADDAAIAADRNNKQAISKNCAPFTICITEINNIQVDLTKDLVIAMPMYNLIEYNNNYSKTSGSLYQFYRNEPNNIITKSESFTFKSKFLGNTNNADIINAKIAVPLKYLSNFLRTLEMPFINCEINLTFNWSNSCVISDGDRVTNFANTGTKLYVHVVTLSIQNYCKCLKQNIRNLQKSNISVW